MSHRLNKRVQPPTEIGTITRMRWVLNLGVGVRFAGAACHEIVVETATSTAQIATNLPRSHNIRGGTFKPFYD
jgi:hypothetical protein